MPKHNFTNEQIESIISLREAGLSWPVIAESFNSLYSTDLNHEAIRKLYRDVNLPEISGAPKVLLFDIETAPMLAYCWGLWDQTVGLNQIYSDWYILSWAAKWLHSNKVMYEDSRKNKNIEDDSRLLKGIWNLLDEADVVITQNGISFDVRKLNARFIMSGMQPPSSFKHIDTKRIAKKHFAFTSNKLEYMSDKLASTYVKGKHKKFPGFELWKECLKGNKEAWEEMEDYNRLDVLALEEVYKKLMPWDSTINFSLYYNDGKDRCHCGSTQFKKNGYYYTQTGKFQRYRCLRCGSESRDRTNLLKGDKRRQRIAR